MTDETTVPPAFRYSGLAIYSLVMGVLSLLWVLFGVAWATFGLLAILAGRRAKAEIDTASYEIEGRMLAVIAVVVGAVGLTTALFELFVVLLNPPA